MDFKITPGSALDLRICDFIVGLDRFDTAKRKESSADNVADPVVSFVLSQQRIKDIKGIPDDQPYDGKPFESYEELAAEAQDIINCPDVQACPSTTRLMKAFQSYIAYRIYPSCMSLKERQFASAQMKVKWVDQAEIDERIAALEEKLLTHYGKTFKSIERPEVCHRQIPAKEIKGYALAIFKRGKAVVEELCGRTTDFSPTLIVKKFDEAWRGWIDGVDNSFKIKFNRRVAPKVSDSELTNTASHELCGHGMQFSIFHDRIAAGEWPLFSGMGSMIEPQFIQAEGLAEIIPVYLHRMIDDFPSREAHDHFQTHLERLYISRLVTNNTAWLVQNGHSAEDALEYGVKYSPDDNAPYMKGWVDSLIDDPLYCSYQAAYGAGQRIFRVALETASPEQFRHILKKCYTEILWPEEINQLMRDAGVPEYALFDTTPPVKEQALKIKPSVPSAPKF